MKHHTHYAETKPDAPAIIMGGSGKNVTWKEHDRRVNQLARYYRDIGLKEKDHIAILMENSQQYVETMDAAVDAGLLYTNISTHLKRNETEYVINNCEAKLLIISERYADLAKQIAATTPNLTHRLMLGTAIDGYDSYEDTIAQYEGVPIEYGMSGMPMYYSSGTTGQPKGISWDVADYPVGSIDPTLEGSFALFQITEDSIYLSTQPLYHSAPSAFVMGILQLGGHHYFDGRV